MKVALVSIDTTTMMLTRYAGRKPTHKAMAPVLKAEVIENFRKAPPVEFFLVTSKEVA
jgi:hypothetical protein